MRLTCVVATPDFREEVFNALLSRDEDGLPSFDRRNRFCACRHGGRQGESHGGRRREAEVSGAAEFAAPAQRRFEPERRRRQREPQRADHDTRRLVTSLVCNLLTRVSLAALDFKPQMSVAEAETILTTTARELLA